MVAIKVKKGLDVPIKGAPSGEVKPLEVNGRAIFPDRFALDLSPFDDKKFRLLVRPGDRVKIGDPLAFDKALPDRLFVSPAGGIVEEVERGLKRRLLAIPIRVEGEEEKTLFHPLDPLVASREELIERISKGGLLPFIRQRPFDLLADPRKVPRAIFISAFNSAPFAPPAELQVKGCEEEFQKGLETLTKLTQGKVHLVMQKGSSSNAFLNAKGVELHTAEGPHPAGLASTHINRISPIHTAEEVVWTLGVPEVIALGFLVAKGEFFTERVLSIGGEGVMPGRTGYIRGRLGSPIAALVEGRLSTEDTRLISGDPLTGHKVPLEGYLGFYHHTLSLIPERKKREILHFFRLGYDKFTASKAYLSGFLKGKLFSFDTNQHGERRAFIIGSPYEKVVPLPINPMLLVKSVLAEDYEEAEKLGLLEVAPEDFALPTFVCPSKIEMIEIVRKGLKRHAAEVTDHL
jgi:Na+-transporting NADH:ubiquinone oxidoreductase subunit A